ncbi:hypothetical protein PQG02_32800 (plasmid) [Nostoc sp. UHCC 0926]|uniref:hypothetical protein n=1 Tax=Nostoc sp. UHCC 0926 TaxID=3025190 RepID=UPI00235EEC99|nr:hypothetical protein [Nostoc sp. UHCC 0926]WDD36369.1 hypothetical protein PQG02_32800 [Nostoc sp. UHCC 0926]
MSNESLWLRFSFEKSFKSLLIWQCLISKNSGVAESWNDFAQFKTNFQWFQPLIHPAFMQRQNSMWSSLFHFGVPAWGSLYANETVFTMGYAPLEAIANRRHHFLVLEEAHLTN